MPRRSGGSSIRTLVWHSGSSTWLSPCWRPKWEQMCGCLSDQVRCGISTTITGYRQKKTTNVWTSTLALAIWTWEIAMASWSQVLDRVINLQSAEVINTGALPDESLFLGLLRWMESKVLLWWSSLENHAPGPCELSLCTASEAMFRSGEANLVRKRPASYCIDVCSKYRVNQMCKMKRRSTIVYNWTCLKKLLVGQARPIGFSQRPFLH